MIDPIASPTTRSEITYKDLKLNYDLIFRRPELKFRDYL